MERNLPWLSWHGGGGGGAKAVCWREKGGRQGVGGAGAGEGR